ncbi:hypothetical protein J7T55_009110 [Diaporthe amygdali]|uniref:uncharacterized protein n=1 Tax=Phomopsis amygdali TaxID=1214568 RepID=UPI0022FDD813|nr:uncharacterized protein J7T55_009110 [Diaporthe amygdali]KAJ0118327.1 hypothetical protein J7T55_009110 [Diaporthe amygdali]
MVWRNASDRLPRRVLISGRDNDRIVIGPWPWLEKSAGVSLLAPYFQIDTSIEFVLVWQCDPSRAGPWPRCLHTSLPPPVSPSTDRNLSNSPLELKESYQPAWLTALPLSKHLGLQVRSSVGHPGRSKNSTLCHWLPTYTLIAPFSLARPKGATSIVGVLFSAKSGPHPGTPSMQAFDVNSADCRPFAVQIQ